MLTPAPSNGPGELARLITSVRAGTPGAQLAAARAEQTPSGGSPAPEPGSAINAESDQLLLDRWLSELEQIAGICCDQQNVMSKELGARLLSQASRLRRYTRSSPALPEGTALTEALKPDW